jgi:hypothetical protein
MPAAVSISLAAEVPVPLVIDLPAGTVRCATWTQNGAVYSAVYVDLEWSDCYDVILHRLADAGEWERVWGRSFPIGEDAAADEAWRRLLADPESRLPAGIRG